MPHLYRPESDKQRRTALMDAKRKYDATAAPLRAFGSATYAHLDAFLTTYGQRIQQRGSALSQQARVTAAIRPQRRMLRLYVGHFIMGLDNAILREELPASDRAYYQLPVHKRTLPKLTTDDDLLMWARNVISGEADRVAAGGTLLSNPTAAQVQDRLNMFTPLCESLTTHRSAYDSAQEAVAELWPEADELIKDIWDEVLFFFRKHEPSSLRRKAREWGLVYKNDKEEDVEEVEEPADK